MLDAYIYQFGLKPLEPVLNEELAVTIDVQLAPNTVFAAGQVLGKVTTAANDVQTVTVSGSPTGGSYQLALNTPNGPVSAAYPLTINHADTTTTIQAAVSAIVGTGNLTVGGTDWSSFTLTAAGSFVDMLLAPVTVLANNLTGGTTPAAAVAHTTPGASANTFGAYASGNSDGTQTAVALLQWPCATDSAGLITVGGQSTGDEWGGKDRVATVYIGGYFDTADLVGLDSGAVTNLGFLKEGLTANGILHVV